MTFKYLLWLFVSDLNIFVWTGYRSIPQIELLLQLCILFCYYLLGHLTNFLYFPYRIILIFDITCLDKRQKYPSDELAVTTLYIIQLLFAWSFDQFATFSI